MGFEGGERSIGSTSGNEMRSSFSAFCDAGQITSYEFLVPLVTAFQDDYDPSTEELSTATYEILTISPAMRSFAVESSVDVP